MSGDAPQLNPAALTIEQAARLLAKVGWPALTEAMLRADIAAGAPTNPSGTINLIHFTAWLVREMGRSAGDQHGD